MTAQERFEILEDMVNAIHEQQQLMIKMLGELHGAMGAQQEIIKILELS